MFEIIRGARFRAFLLLGLLLAALPACTRLDSEKATTNQNAERPVFYGF